MGYRPLCRIFLLHLHIATEIAVIAQGMKLLIERLCQETKIECQLLVQNTMAFSYSLVIDPRAMK